MDGSKEIFLVEDDKDDQELFIECIEKIDNAKLYGVSQNGIEALEKLENTAKLPDIIFMDVNMPLMNGVECLTEIMKNSRIKDIPVVMLSTAMDYAHLTSFLGAKAFINKTAGSETLHTKVEQMIKLQLFGNTAISSNPDYRA